MRKVLIIVLFMVQLLLAPSLLRSQGSYPIYVSPALLPPYSLNLSDYSAIGSQRLMLTIVVNDLDVANLPVKLRIKMETAGVTIETPLTLNTIPVYLDGGSATVLFGEDLRDYFNINNLQFKGYSKEAYQRSGQLPEGFYRFSVEVLHFHTNRVISNTGSVSAWIALGKPPVLRSPSNEAELGQYMGVPITFSWLASNVGSPVSAGSIRYKFEMWEQRVKGVNPYNIVSSMPVFHEHTSSSSSYSLNPASLMMEEGMSYVWRVTAYDESGLVPFAQNGHSEVRSFTYKSHCAGIEDISVSAVGQKGSFTWTPDKHHSSYNVEVRNTAKDIFISGETFDSKVEYYDLERGQTYELRVQAVCNGDPFSVSDYSEWAALTIPEAKPKINYDECPECECRDELPKVELTNFELRQDLSPGDTLSNRTGTTRFIVQSVKPEGSNSYSGIFYFWAEIWGIKIPCTYTGLQVNTDNVIVNMNYKSINDPKFLANIDALSEGGNEFLDNLAAATARTAIKDTIVVPAGFDYIIEQDGRLMAVVIDDNGEPKETPLNITVGESKQALITNEQGDEVVISAKGEPMGVKEFQATGGNSRLMNSYKEEKERKDLTEGAMLSFSAHQNQKYGFDEYSPLKINIRNSYPTLGKDYRPAFKSIESFSFDRVNLQPEPPNSLTFRDEAGIPAHVSGTDVTVRGAAADSNRALYAYRALTDSTEEIVGKLNLLSFDKVPNRVHIIAVNGAKTPSQFELEQSLKDIYRQAIAGWTVISEPGVRVSFEGGRMTHEGAGSFSTYNADQGAIVSAYEATGRKIERKDFYLFFVDGAAFKDRSLAGYMPLQRQVGFIYDNPSVEIIAHELGHGAFNLRHPFSPEAFIATEGSTRNLMDYAGGTELWLHQWHSVQNPSRILFAWAQDESEGAMIQELTAIVKFEKGRLPIQSGRASFFTPAGLPISFADMGKMEEMYFTLQNVDDNFSQENKPDVVNRIVADRGILVAFKYDNKFFVPVVVSSSEAVSGTIKASDYLFKGYKYDDFYIENVTTGNSANTVYWYDKDEWKKVEFCYDYRNYINGQTFNAEGYKGAGYYATFMERRTAYSCENYLTGLKELDNLDFFNSTLTARYNPWNKEGLLQKIEDRQGEVRLVYSILQANGTKEAHEYDYILEDWVKIDIATAGFSSYMDISLIKEIAQYYGHSTLDIIGFIPIAGEIADALNGLWYLVEGKQTDALLCFAGMLPVVGDAAVKTTKYTIRAIKGARLGKAYSLTGESLQSHGRISDMLKTGERITCEECLEISARLLSENPGQAATVERLVGSISRGGNLSNAARLLENFDILVKTDITGKFPQLRDATGKFRGAGTMWARSGDEVATHFSHSGKYMLKHDKSTHELLFVDLESGNVLGYYLDEIVDGSTVRRVLSNNYNEIAIKLERLHKGGTITTPSGYTITSKPGKTTTILGSYDPDTKKVIEETGNLKNHNFNAKDGGFNVLNVPDNYYQTAKQFWDDYNVKFLDEAITRGDDIVLATNPLQLESVFDKLTDIPSLKNVGDLTQFLKEYTVLPNLKGFGKELKYLFDKGYRYDSINNIFIK